MGVDAVGVNCSVGPDQLIALVKNLKENLEIPILVKPNAGIPQIDELGQAHYNMSEETFAQCMKKLHEAGASVLGGCCGTTPLHISKLVDACSKASMKYIIEKNKTVISSYTHAVEFGNEPILIGERINPTGKKLFKEALINNDINYILNEGIKQQEAGVHVLDVNVGLPDIDEEAMLKKVIYELQAIIDIPLQIDTSDVKALESALRIYNGKPLINSVNGKQESMDSVFPLAKKYGGVIIALTLDEKGIPTDSKERLMIADKIIKEAKKYGIERKDLIFDPLALAISTDSSAGIETLKAIEMITKKLGCKTSLGVSNVSFGLPYRDIINASFLTGALYNGLSAAIINPFSEEIMKAYHSFCTIKGLDENCSNYIEYAENLRAREDAKIELITMSQHTNTASNNTNTGKINNKIFFKLSPFHLYI
jgi:5-methyltetrahydrofolate--homocysteine methyltransferase